MSKIQIALYKPLIFSIIMRKAFRFFMLTLCCGFASCSYQLLPPTVQKVKSLSGYRYAYITPTTQFTSSTPVGSYNLNNYVTGGSNTYVYGGKTTSVNPKDVIAGYLIQMGYIVIPEIKENIADKTFIVNYGELGSRTLSLFAYTRSVSIQILSAIDYTLLISCEAEGIGSNEAEDIHQAIIRGLDGIFKTN